MAIVQDFSAQHPNFAIYTTKKSKEGNICSAQNPPKEFRLLTDIAVARS